MTEIENREKLIKIALSWERTPFHDNAGVKGAGVDCAWYPFRAFVEARLIKEFKMPKYHPQFLLHNKREVYLEVVETHARRIDVPQAADLAMFYYGTCFSHGAIILDWPNIIHARKPVGVTRENAYESSSLSRLDRGSANVLGANEGDPRPFRFYTLKSWDGIDA